MQANSYQTSLVESQFQFESQSEAETPIHTNNNDLWSDSCSDDENVTLTCLARDLHVYIVNNATDTPKEKRKYTHQYERFKSHFKHNRIHSMSITVEEKQITNVRQFGTNVSVTVIQMLISK